MRRSRHLIRIVLLALAALLLVACGLRPGELAMRQAITAHVGAAENYPMRFLQADHFRFRDLQKVDGEDVATYRVHAAFDFVYTADGATIVAALKDQAQAEREKESRRDDSVLGKLARAAADALARHGTEERFASVKTGDADHYEGDFTLVRNEDGSWRVLEADYR